MIRFLLLAGIGWTDCNQGAVLAGVAAVALIGFQICRLMGAGEF
jgi:hypothetical protein